VEVIRIGMGPARATSAAVLLPSAWAVAVVGFGGAVDESLRPGAVLVASEVRFEGRVLPCPSARFLAGELARAGLPVRSGPLATSDHIVTGAERHELAAEGVLVVDMETGPLAGAVANRPFAALRVVVDTPAVPLLRPATIRGGIAAYRTLRRLGPILARWAASTGPPARWSAYAG
jgi:4-hydroxy-3-methylbut-2-enyl diphosphate reductase